MKMEKVCANEIRITLFTNDEDCGDVGGSVDAGGSVTANNIKGDIDAGGSVHIKK